MRKGVLCARKATERTYWLVSSNGGKEQLGESTDTDMLNVPEDNT